MSYLLFWKKYLCFDKRRKMKTRIFLQAGLLVGLLFCLWGCKSAEEPYWLGADISFARSQEARGFQYKNGAGEPRECTALMKELGLNAISLRVGVNPKPWVRPGQSAPDPADPLLTTYQFAVNPNGRLWDGKLKIGDTISDIWNSKNVKVRVTRQSNRWIVDMSVPFSELGVTPAPGKQMKVNFVRNRVTGGKTKENSCFAPSFISLNFMPQRFGTLILGK